MEQQAFLQKRAKMRREKSIEKMSESSVDLNSGIPLGIFEGPMSQSTDSHLLQKWRACNQRELDILSTPPPRNALEEMIVQTKQGKLWQFPIDNEQGNYLYFKIRFCRGRVNLARSCILTLRMRCLSSLTSLLTTFITSLICVMCNLLRSGLFRGSILQSCLLRAQPGGLVSQEWTSEELHGDSVPWTVSESLHVSSEES